MNKDGICGKNLILKIAGCFDRYEELGLWPMGVGSGGQDWPCPPLDFHTWYKFSK